MPLYTVPVTITAVIEAEKILKEPPFNSVLSEFPNIEVSNLPDDWDNDCIPFGGDGNTRLKDHPDFEAGYRCDRCQDTGKVELIVGCVMPETGNLYIDDHGYCEFIDECTKKCSCCPDCFQDIPCGGVQGGGVCDEACCCDDSDQFTGLRFKNSVMSNSRVVFDIKAQNSQ